MKKTINIVAMAVVLTTSLAGFATTPNYNAGGVYMGTDLSPENHAVRYALEFDGGVQTGFTGCISPNTGTVGYLDKAAMGGHTGDVKILAEDCVKPGKIVKTQYNVFKYDPSYYYRYACTLNSTLTCRPVTN